MMGLDAGRGLPVGHFPYPVSIIRLINHKLPVQRNIPETLGRIPKGFVSF